MLLSINNDAKTSKGNEKGYLTGILYLAPYDLSGFQTCAKATKGCAAACLNTAGRGVYNKVQQARINKTKRFFNNKNEFLAELVDDIEFLIRKARRLNLIPAVRLNGTSDLPWEKFAVYRNDVKFSSIMEAFPEVKFYDYTAILNRKKALSLPNYHLTFSLKENNDKDAVKALEQGYNVAVVLNTRRSEVKPTAWSGYPVINGDYNDLRFIDPKGGHIVALSMKGKARYDSSGFVRDKNAGFRLTSQ